LEVQNLILFVHSSLDIAGVNIANSVLEGYPFTKAKQTYQNNPVYTAEINGRHVHFLTLKEEAVNAQYLQEDYPNVELVVFLSRHSSQSGKPTLSVHAPGNFGDAELGGLPRTLSVSSASAMQNALKALVHFKEALNLNNYEVSFECTHHGPSLNVPAMFVELGSSQGQWGDLKAAKAVAHSAMHAVANFNAPATSPMVLGIGGTHYNQKFTVMTLVGAAAFGHMIPKYAVSLVDAQMLSQCVEKTLEKVPLAILDWKGIKGEDKEKLLAALESAGLPYKKV
jgi:D-aminoacyl-tRNA deacylase